MNGVNRIDGCVCLHSFEIDAVRSSPHPTVFMLIYLDML